MRYYWVRDIIRQNHFHIIWEESKNNLAEYVIKYHPIWNHKTIRPRYVKTKKSTKRTQNTVKLGPEESVLELPILGEPGNSTIPSRESGIQFPGTQIIPLKESGI